MSSLCTWSAAGPTIFDDIRRALLQAVSLITVSGNWLVSVQSTVQSSECKQEDTRSWAELKMAQPRPSDTGHTAIETHIQSISYSVQ